MSVDLNPNDYKALLADIEQRIRTRQARAVLAVNRENIELYWEIGELVVQRQEQHLWGDAVVERLAKDLQAKFPGMSGFSRPQVFFMRRFYLTYRSSSEKVLQAVRQIPWGQNITLMTRIKGDEERAWYALQTFENGWSRSDLNHQIDEELYRRQGKAIKTHNFTATLPSPHSDLVEQALKDEYIFDFLNLGPTAKERQIEKALLERIKEFLLELGSGFAFLGNQYPLEVEGRTYYLDLLFYHYKLRCLVAIELKVGEFEPEFAGKMNFYLNALNHEMKHPSDNPSVGIILCHEKKHLTTQYALEGMTRPIGVSTYTTQLPPELQGSLPTPEQFEELLNEGRNE